MGNPPWCSLVITPSNPLDSASCACAINSATTSAGARSCGYNRSETAAQGEGFGADGPIVGHALSLTDHRSRWPARLAHRSRSRPERCPGARASPLPASGDRAAPAVDHQRLAGDVPGVLAQQEPHGRADVGGRIAEPVEGDAPHHPLLHGGVGDEGLGHGRRLAERSHGVDPHTGRSPLAASTRTRPRWLAFTVA